MFCLCSTIFQPRVYIDVASPSRKQKVPNLLQVGPKTSYHSFSFPYKFCITNAPIRLTSQRRRGSPRPEAPFPTPETRARRQAGRFVTTLLRTPYTYIYTGESSTIQPERMRNVLTPRKCMPVYRTGTAPKLCRAKEVAILSRGQLIDLCKIQPP